MEHIVFFGVRFVRHARPDDLRLEVASMLHGRPQHMIVTPNPEMLVLAHRDPAFREVLNRADLALPDGVGIAIMSRILRPSITRMPGIDFLLDVLFPIAEQEGKSIFFLGAQEGVAERAAREIMKTFPRLRIAGVASGGAVTLREQGGLEARPDDAALLSSIADTAPDILLVAFGQRKQEFWISEHLHDLPSVRVAIGVGGSFDFLAGRIRRAPQIVRRIGLEWMWRFFLEPRRMRRIMNAVVVFPLLACYDVVRKRD